MTSMIDSHVHLWDPSVRDYPWLDDEPTLRRPYGIGDLDPEAVGVTGAVVVEAGCRQDQAAAELDWLEALAVETPVIRGIVAQVPLERGRAVAPLLAGLAARPLVVGVRRNLQDETPDFLSDPDLVRGVRCLAGTGLTFDACIRHHQLAHFTGLVDRCADVVFVLDHLAKPAVAEDSRQPWQHDLAELARRPNVVVKLSGLTTEADRHNWSSAQLAPFLAHALDVFGPARCMYGSDWPVATLATTYRRWQRIVLDLVAPLSPAEQADVLNGTATRTYGLAA